MTRVTMLLSALAVAFLLLLSPAAATEAGGGEGGGAETTQTEEGGGGEGDERNKIQLAETPSEWVGIVLIIFLGLGVLLALDNARRQLKGERKQATGEWRWR